ncbi:retrotransposon protein, putative, ty1-copia subclass [Tanacetum coccineum]
MSNSWESLVNSTSHGLGLNELGLRESRKLKPRALSLYVGNGQREAVEAIGVFHLCLLSGLEIVLNNCHYAPSITRGVIYVSCLYEDGFVNCFVNNTIQVSRNNIVYFSAIPRDGIFEINLSNSYANDSSIYTVSNKRAKLDLDSALLWHCRLGNISKKRIEKLQHDGLLNSTNLRAFEKCVPFFGSSKGLWDYRPSYSSLHTTTQGCVGEEKQNPTRYGLIHDGQSIFHKLLWDYALRMRYAFSYGFPTKKVENTPYEVWHRQAPKLSYLKVWGCEALVKRDTLTKSDKLEPKSIKCIVIGYLKETMGYSFYYPPENKVLVARNAEFLENTLITQEASRKDDLKIDEPQSDIIPIRRSTRTRNAPNRMCLYIDAEEHELGDLGEPANYKTVLLDPKSDKWLNDMNVEMQSLKDNEVWDLVDLPPNGKTVGSKWLFKKKTDMDGAVHTYKACLVAKTYTQTLRIDYEETFSPITNIRAIRILIAIAAFYDYEIWQMDVKTAFLNGYLSEEDMRCTRPDVAFAQNITSQFQQNPGDLQWTIVKKILKYLRNTKDMFLVYGGDIKRELRVSCYPDDGYLTDADDLKSQTRYVFILNGGAVDWKSAKQSIFATSSAEAEYITAYDASKEAVWVRKFIYGLGVVPTIEEPINMYCDNTGGIAIAKESGITKGAKHFRSKVHYLREVIEFCGIKLEKVHTNDNLDDRFTKALAFPKHSEHTRNIGMLPACSLMLFALESQKKIDVASKLSQCGLDFSFRRAPRGGIEQNQFEMLTEKMKGCVLVNMQDRWVWSLEGSGDFSVASVRNLIDGITLPEVSTKTRWIKEVPIKINVHAWKVKIDCLPTRLNISRRGMDIDSILCPMCGIAVEFHLFFTCHISRDILRKISRWWDIEYTEIASYEEWWHVLENYR